MKLFVYGTLTKPGIQRAVIGRVILPEHATLSGFVVEDIHPCGAPYKTLNVGEESSVANGWTLDIEEKDLPNLDAYESCPSLYKRIEVTINQNGTLIPAYSYIATEYYDRVQFSEAVPETNER